MLSAVYLSVAMLFGADGWLLVNSQVREGEELSASYQELYPEVSMQRVSLDIDPLEVVDRKSFEERVAPVIKALLEGGRPKWMLSFYGLPLLVDDGQRLTSFDQAITVLTAPGQQPGKLVFNPQFFEPEGEAPWAPIPVLRLDAPATQQARWSLESWARFRHWGGFRRCLPFNDQGTLAAMLTRDGHRVHPRSDLRHLRPGELQMLEFQDDEWTRWEKVLDWKDSSLAPGSLFIHYHNGSRDHGAFRGHRAGAAGKVARLGASFFIGSLHPRSSEEDLFDSTLFYSRWLRGRSFHEAVLGAMPNLGGSMLVLGDPLAAPYGPQAEKHREERFSSEKFPEEAEAFAKAFARAQDWWLARDHLRMWEQARFEMAVAAMRYAVLKRESALFRELQGDALQQLGRRQQLLELWKDWPVERRGDWEWVWWEKKTEWIGEFVPGGNVTQP